jgi:N-acetylmuramoyl-L-alanine amidase
MSHSGRIASARARAVLAVVLAAALLATGPAAALATESIFIDPGHGGPYNHVNAFGLREKHVNLWLGIELRNQLAAKGYGVGMTRSTDAALTTRDINTWHWDSARRIYRFYKDGIVMGDPPIDDLQARCNAANDAGADVFISIHNNAGPATARGTETWSDPSDDLGNQLSRYVQQAVIEQTGMKNRGSKETGFYVLKWTNMPAVLIEGGFLTNQYDARLLSSPAFRTKMVRGIVIGLERWLATDPFKRVYPHFGGATPADVAAAASAAGFAEGAVGGSVLLVSSSDPTSAMTAAPLSRKLGAPVLVADPSELPTATAAELARLRPESVIAIGPAATLSEAVLEAARGAAGGGESRRIAGANVYATAALVAAEVGVPPTGRVVIASGESFADAITASSIATGVPSPVLLTAPGAMLSPETSAFLTAYSGEVSQTVVVGLPTSVWPSAVAALPRLTRLSGATDSYQTNVAVLRSVWPSGYFSPIVAGWRPSASTVVAAAAAARGGQPLVLNSGRGMSSYTREWVQNNGPRARSWTIVGTDAEQPYLADWVLRKAIGPATAAPPAPSRVPTGTITIGAAPSSVRLPKPFVLSGVLGGGKAGDRVVVMVQKPGSGRWSYSSARLTYDANGSWWYRYTPRLRGVYRFKSTFAGDALVPACTSRILSVSVR